MRVNYWHGHRAGVCGLAVYLTLSLNGFLWGCSSKSAPAEDTTQVRPVDTAVNKDVVAPEDVQTDTAKLWVDLENCRPVDHLWDPETEPMMQPCTVTKEACDGVDNDLDGITDPKCPTIPCDSDADCTYDGLVADADCNGWGGNGGECNQIDGVGDAEPCRGMLCPPKHKCVEGDCVIPGDTQPGEACSSGADCPVHAGCIPEMEFNAGETAVCKYFCHDFPCPEGFRCWTKPFQRLGTEFVTYHAECSPFEEHVE